MTMTTTPRTWLTGLGLVAVACGGTGAPTGSTAGPVTANPAAVARARGDRAGDGTDRFGPLEVGADYLSYRRVTPEPFLSAVHGDRWVDVYVNEVGADAYLDNGEMPVGSIVVKTSWQDEAGAPSTVPGPLYIMERRPAGYAPEHGDWYFAIHWANPTPDQAGTLGGPLYWRGRSARVAYCYDCHDNYDRGLGGLVPSSVVPR